MGNPIFPGIGNKRQEETDYIGNGPFPLAFRRIYNSAPQFGQSQLGQSWKFSYAQSITYLPKLFGIGPIATLNRPEGSYSFTRVGSAWIGDADVNYRLLGDNGAFSVTTPDGREIESYDANNNLYQVSTASGTLEYSLTYSTTSTPASVAPAAGLLLQVSDAFGHALNLTYDGLSRLTTMTDPNGGLYQYGYDANDNLTSVTYPDGTSRRYVYDESSLTGGADLPNALTGIVDESNGRYANFGYAPTGMATLTEHAGGADHYLITYSTPPTVASEVVYDAGGNPTYVLNSYVPPSGVTVTDGLGATRNYGFTTVAGSVRASGVDQPCNASCTPVPQSQSFDGNGNVSSITDFNGNVTHYSYDLTRNLELFRVEAFGTPRARTIATTWNPTFRLPATITEPNRTTSLTYDSMGNVLTRTITNTAVTPNIARTWTYTYDSYGRMLTAKGPRTDVDTTLTYTYYTCTTGSQCGQVHTVTNALNQTTTYNTYNVSAKPLTITDPNGVVTTLTYDARQRLTSRQVGAEATTFSYWPTGLLKQVTLPDSSYLLYTYDAAHRLTQISDGLGNSIDYTLDAMGNRTAENVFDPSNTLHRTHSRVFNTLSQLSKDVNAAGIAAVTTTFAYDSNGNQTSISAPLSRNTSNAYDELNRLQQITDPASGITQFAYDANDNLTSVIDPRHLSTSYAYNGFGDLLTQTSPDTGTTTNTYDSAGNLATSTDARGAVATYSYDALNRVTSVAYSQGGSTDQTISFSYDVGTNGKGHLTGAADANHSLSWSYDALGRVTGRSQTIGGVTKSVAYAYTSGNLTSLTTPSGQTVTYGYNTNHQVTSVAVNGTTVLNNVTYEPLGPVNGWMWGNGGSVSRLYDRDGNVSQITSGGETYQYTEDEASRITAISNSASSALSWSYGYDSLDRLTSASSLPDSENFAYTPTGTRLSWSGTAFGQGFSGSYVVDPGSNRISSISLTGPSGQSTAVQYDAVGNVVSEWGTSVTYNGAGRAIALTGMANLQATYNALSQRISKTTASCRTLFVYDEAGDLLGEYDGSGMLIEETIWLGDIPVATLRPNSGSVAIYYVHSDHLNTPRKVSRPSDNQLVWRWDANPFATQQPQENPLGIGRFVYNLRFPGQYFDAESGFHYNHFRYYDPLTGAYAQSDPTGLKGGIGTYTYVNNTPAMERDSDGLEAVSYMMRHPFLSPPTQLVRPEVKAYLCGLISACNGDPECVFEWTNADRLANRPSTWFDATLREAENWAYAASHDQGFEGVLFWQLRKLIHRQGTSPWSTNALFAGWNGNYHRGDTDEQFKKWCANGCGK